MAPYEMRETLREAKSWGFTAYGDWFDAADLKNPHNNPRREFLLPQAIWDRKQEFFRIAGEVGLQTNLLVSPNHVYLDQLEPDLLAETKDRRFFGQLICPSKPRAREIILDNSRRALKDLKDRGAVLDSLTFSPFDYGGCSCASCAPWIVTFGKLSAEIHDIARQLFPEVKARLCGWWWTEEEHKLFAEWADREHPGRFISLSGHLPYGTTRPDPDIVLPRGCELHAFVHIGYTEKAQPRDVYGTWGPVIAANRLATTVYELEGIRAAGYAAYSEGHCDDVNKALLGGLSSGRYQDTESLLAAYAEKYFGAQGSDARSWARWLIQWGEAFTVDVARARKDFDMLSRTARKSWRLAQWEARLRIFEAHQEVLNGKEWDEKRLQAADRFFEERDRLFREIWGLGLVRHVLNPRYHKPSWLQDYLAAKGSRQRATDSLRSDEQ